MYRFWPWLICTYSPSNSSQREQPLGSESAPSFIPDSNASHGHWLSINGTLEELIKVSKVKILPILISIHSWVLNYWKDHNDTSYMNWAQWIDPIRSSFKIRCKGLLLQYHVILQSHHIIRSIGVGYPFSCVFMRQRDKTNNKPFQLSIIVNYWLFQ